MYIEGNLVDVLKEQVYPAKITFNDKIINIEKTNKKHNNYILPGLIDAHIHIESSMLVPSRFAEATVPNGTVAVVADPHEIANVLGIKGINYMINDSKQVPLKFYFAAPSCVPATAFETSGACLDSKKIESLLKKKQIVALAEMMNFPGVIFGDKEVLKKIQAAKKLKKPIDGHAPGLTGNQLKKYVKAGITTEHECTSYNEALEKAKLGMKILIREGSSAKNMKALIKLANNYDCMLVSDDKHSDDLVKGHINELLRKAVKLGINPIKAIKLATLIPSLHYKLDTGIIKKKKSADFVVVDNLKNFNVKKVFIDGKLVAKDKALFKVKPKKIKDSFKVKKKNIKDFIIFTNNKAKKSKARVIGVLPDQIVTKELTETLEIENKQLLPNIKKDILKIAVIERYGHNRMSVAFVKGFGLKKGAIASSVAHDSHNIIAVGTNCRDMVKAVNTLIDMKGGLVAVDGNKAVKLELPIAGLMSTENVDIVNKKLKKINDFVKNLGCKLKAPFGTLSFMALLVIPELKLSDKGLFDGKNFNFVDLVKEE